MGQQRIEIVREFAVPVEKLFAHLSEHENLAALFAPARIKRIRDGTNARNGVNSAREIRILLAPAFVETVTAYVQDELIEYRITQGSPLKNHHGVMRFAKTPTGGSRLQYTIVFEGKFPLVAILVRRSLEQIIRSGLDKLRI